MYQIPHDHNQLLCLSETLDFFSTQMAGIGARRWSISLDINLLLKDGQQGNETHVDT